MTGDADQEYFVDGMVEEITTAIARLHWLFVIARNSAFTYKGKAVDVKQVTQELGVRYVLEGSVRKAGNRVRITGQLIDTTTGAHIWADRFDGALDDIFELQDQVASSVVGAIEPKLVLAETERAIRKPTESLSAYDLYLRALAQIHKITQPGRDAAIVLLAQALVIDPSYAPAAAAVGWCRLFQTLTGSPVSSSEVADSLRLATQVIETGKDQPDALWMAAYTLSMLGGAHATAAGTIDRALALNQNSAYVWSARSFVAAFQDQPDLAIEASQRAIRLSPLDPQRWMFFFGMSVRRGEALRGNYRLGRSLSARTAAPTSCVSLESGRLRPSRPRARGSRGHPTHVRVAPGIHALFVRAHQPRIAGDIGGEDRSETAGGGHSSGTLAALRAVRRDLADPKIAEHRGRIVKTTGDGLLIEFPSVIEAISCAVAVQRGMAERNAGTPEEKRIAFRIGVNLGDIIVEDGDIHGDGVNIAPGSRASPSLAASASPRTPSGKSAAKSMPSSRIWASRASRTSQDRCVFTATAACRQLRLSYRRPHCLSRTSRRWRSCPFRT